MKEVVLDPQAIEDIKWWIQQDRKLALKIMELIEELPKSPFSGKGKPERLRFNLSGLWSRRITQEHRLVYEVTDDFIRVVSCRYHYR
jgi:toxin YoeB